MHRVDVLDRLAALRLLDHNLAQHAKQVSQSQHMKGREEAGAGREKRAGLTPLCVCGVVVVGGGGVAA